MKKTVVTLCSAMLLLCATQGAVNAQLSPVVPPVVDPPVVIPPVVIPPVVIPPVVVPINPWVIVQSGVDRMREVTQEVNMRRQGFSMANPFLPFRSISLSAGRVQFFINVIIVNIFSTMWVDPVIAVGYDYVVEKGPKITGVELPKGIGDNVYDLWAYQSGNYIDSGVDLEGGILYKFKEPISNFSIRGIETSAEMNPKNETAFPTGLRFEKTGKSVIKMTSVTQEI